MIEKTINLDGSTHKVKYPNSAVRKIDEALGYSAMHIVEKAQQHGALASLSINDLACVVWGGLLHKSPGLTLDQAADMIPLRPIEKYAAVAEQVFGIIMDIYGLDAQIDVDPEATPEGNEQADRGSGTGEESSK